MASVKPQQKPLLNVAIVSLAWVVHLKQLTSPNDGLYIQADLTKLDSFETIFARLREYCDRLDVLVNNAAYQITKPFLETTVEEWDTVMATNLRPAF